MSDEIINIFASKKSKLIYVVLIVLAALLIVALILIFDTKMQINDLNRKISSNFTSVRQEINNKYDELNTNINLVFAERENLIAYWAFNKNYFQDLKGKNDIINHGTTFTTQGKAGGAVEFNGKDSYLTLPKLSEDFNISQGAISFWIYPEMNKVAQGFGGLMYYRKGDCCADSLLIKLFKAENGDYIQVYAEINDTRITDLRMNESSIKENEWNNIVIQQTGEEILVYVNGQKQKLIGLNSRDWFANHFPATYDFTVGHRGSWDDAAGNQGFFKGKISEIKIWNKPLSEAEIVGMNA